MSKNVYHIGSGALTFEIIERIINEKPKTGTSSRSQVAHPEMS